jgi:hypothetical protein
MRLLKQPSPWSCMPTSLAMLADVTPEDIFMDMGHDGSDPNPDGPHGRVAFGGHELILAAYGRGIWLVPFLCKHPSTGDAILDVQTLVRLTEAHAGILAGNWRGNGSPHAVAWDNERLSVHEPGAPRQYDWRHFNELFNIEVFFAWMRPRLS